MDRRVTPPKRVTSPTWGPPPSCEQALNVYANYRVSAVTACHALRSRAGFQGFSSILLLHEKFLQFDWLRAVVFQLNLKYLHVKITKPLRVVV